MKNISFSIEGYLRPIDRVERHFGLGNPHSKNIEVHGEKAQIARELGFDPKNLTLQQKRKVDSIYNRKHGV